MTTNPFRFLAEEDRGPLIARDAEIDAVVQLFREGSNLVLAAPRASGKTALLRAAMARAKSESFIPIYVGLAPAINTRRFAEIYASALTLGPGGTVEAMQEAVQRLVPTLVPRVIMSGSGQPGLQLNLWDRDRDLRALLERIFEAPGQMAETGEQPVAVIFDDFEDFLGIADASLLQTLAQAIRRQPKVCYCFVLRRDTTVEKTFSKPKSPFYKLGEPVRLDPVPESAVIVGLEQRFQAAGVSIDVDTLFALVAAAHNVPHYVQMLAHAVFNEAAESGAATKESVAQALVHVLNAANYSYKFQWDALSPHQRNLVLAVSQGHTERLHSQRMVFELGLGSPSTVSKNLRVLGEREILVKHENSIHFVDPFFGLWLKRRMT